jgi:predicted DNA-binding protein (MmcQ/YjbR family)
MPLLWGAIILDGQIPLDEIERMIERLFELVVSESTKREQASILVLL